MFTQTVKALASAIDARDPSTKKHSEHVSDIAVEIGQAMSLSEPELEQLEWAGLLHDIGKIGIRDAVLLKPEKLTVRERETIERADNFDIIVYEGGGGGTYRHSYYRHAAISSDILMLLRYGWMPGEEGRQALEPIGPNLWGIDDAYLR